MDQRRIVPRATKRSFHCYNTHIQIDPAELAGHLDDITEEYFLVNIIYMYHSSCIKFQLACVYIVSTICADEL